MQKVTLSQRPRRDIDLDRISQVLRGSASDDLIAVTNCFVFNSLFYGEPVQLLEKMFGAFCSTRFKDELAAEFCTCWCGLMIVCGQPASMELQ